MPIQLGKMPLNPNSPGNKKLKSLSFSHENRKTDRFDRKKVNSDSSGYDTNFKNTMSLTSRDSANQSPSSESDHLTLPMEKTIVSTKFNRKSYKKISSDCEDSFELKSNSDSRECNDSFCSEKNSGEDEEEQFFDDAPKLMNAMHSILDRLQKNVLKRISSNSSDEHSDEELDDLQKIILRQEKELNSIKLALSKAESRRQSNPDIAKKPSQEIQTEPLEIPPPVIKDAKTLHISLIQSSQIAEALTSSYTQQITDIQTNEELKHELKHCQATLSRLKAQLATAKANLESSQNLAENLDLIVSQEECNRSILSQIVEIYRLRTEVTDLISQTHEREISLLKIDESSSITLKKSKRQRFQREFIKSASDIRLKIISYFTKSTEKQPSLPLISSLNDVLSLKTVYLKHLDLEIEKLSSLIRIPDRKYEKATTKSNSSTDIELAIMVEELMISKERIYELEAVRMKTFPDTLSLTKENLNAFQEEELKFKLRSSLNRENCLKNQVNELKSQLHRLQSTSSEQQRHSSKFIKDLKIQNSLLKKMKSES